MKLEMIIDTVFGQKRVAYIWHPAIGVTTLRQEEATASSWFLEVVSLSLKLKPSRQFFLSGYIAIFSRVIVKTLR